MLTDLQLRNFRCFESLSVELEGGFNFFVGGNGQGKTSILEAVCVLLRLQSQRSSSLVPLIRLGEKSFVVSGHADAHLLQFYFSGTRRKAAFDGVEQRTAAEYLSLARVVWFANTDIELARGSSEARRRYVDFLAAQIYPIYRQTLRSYERALRSRNALLKRPVVNARELAAYDPPLLKWGAQLTEIRAQLVARLAPFAEKSHRAIGGQSETLQLAFVAGSGPDFSAALAESREEELRLRQTVVGPHRDDIELVVQGRAVAQFASEGQQRTVALALKLAQAAVLTDEDKSAPILLLDDVFGELDPERRNALVAALDPASQKLVAATSLAWHSGAGLGRVSELHNGSLRSR